MPFAEVVNEYQCCQFKWSRTQIRLVSDFSTLSFANEKRYRHLARKQSSFPVNFQFFSSFRGRDVLNGFLDQAVF